MKKNLAILSLLVLLIVFSITSFGQLSGPDSDNHLYTSRGLTVQNPGIYEIHLGKAAGGPDDLFGMGYIGFNLKRILGGANQWSFSGNGASNGGALIYSGVLGDLFFVTKPSSSGAAGSTTNIDISNLRRMKIDKMGKVVIGDKPFLDAAHPGSYNLYVQNGILTEKVKVALYYSSQWSDYVFEDDYNLMPLAEVDQFIVENKHLPGVPSAQEVVDNGLDLAEMDATLLKKIEELTLYIIDQQKEIENLRKEVANLKK